MKFCASPDPRLVAALAILLASPAAAEIEWRESYYNPAPAEGDMVLPMPCGGAMTFRPVTTPNSGGTIGDVRVTLGQEGEDLPYLNGLRRSYVSGAFEAPDDAEGGSPKGLFWLGKYEIAEAQWDAVMSQTCPDKPRKRAFAPAADHSALDYARFAEAYSLWLMREAPDALPVAGDTMGYLRLPTEDEWEYAARGGLEVDDARFRNPRPPLPEGREPSEHIAHGGTDSAGGQVQVIGTLEPNPLGLHDMLGNVAEVVETPFALVRHGRLHGQAGGVVKRGGDARTPLSGITSATRFEVPPIDVNTKAPSADRYTGARLAIAGLSIVSAEQSARLIEDLDRLAQIDPKLASASSEAEIALILEDLESRLDSPQGRQQLAVIRETIAAARAERNAQRDRTIRLVLESGTLICDQVVQRLLNALAISSIQQNYAEMAEAAREADDRAMLDELDAARAEADESLDKLELQMRSELAEYANVIEGLAGDYSRPLLAEHVEFIREDVARRGERRAACLVALDHHLTERAEDGFVDTTMLENDLRDLAIRRGTAQ